MMNDDLISRAAAKEAVHNRFYGGAAELARIFKEIDNVPAVDHWISLKDRLPESGELILVFVVGKYGHFIRTMITGQEYFWPDCEITHWMRIPQPPKEDEDNDAEQ